MPNTRSAAARGTAGPSTSAEERAEKPKSAGAQPKARKSGRATTAAAAAAAAAGAAEEAPAAEAPRSKRQRKEVALPELAGLPCFPAGPSLVRVGTSGLPQRLEWERYAQEFDMLTLVGASRVVAKQAPQLYSHYKRLNVDDNFIGSWTRFWASCQRLRPHLGLVLFQFPSNFRTTAAAKGKGQPTINNIDRLRRLGEVLPAGERFVFEFRDASWFCQEVYDVLRAHNWCLAITVLTDLPGNRKRKEDSWIGSLTPGPNPPPVAYPLDCCDWGVYVRFHGSTGQYRGAYGATEMAKWAGWAAKWTAQGREAWFAFNNDNLAAKSALPAAVLDCRDLASALRQCKLWH
ncbi:hypothetical protein C2E21_1706 [Chlorella sorokiniana]|uniref:Uncharacterized protein n=1 Tax=Chlorella sorokiniana TaxID=3076 RepID=A0A2P6TZR5_CHLSO|nr:hypothetical protein C2E21_1706 [Chlorella sorokiniana]|eukprot:PRW59561.1 hypothetical protein C2E21_1706 [Chlorella sorokiniana]